MGKRKRVIFDDWESLVHFMAGFCAAFLPLILLVFVIYQWWEWEAAIKKVGDFIEFFVGWAFGISALILVLFLIL